jgi:hypothetical protein
MIEVAMVISLVGGGIGALFFGLAKLRMADAWKIWAQRCDPMNPSFRPPLISRLP